VNTVAAGGIMPGRVGHEVVLLVTQVQLLKPFHCSKKKLLKNATTEFVANMIRPTL
jgi:hypothetical protein